MERQTLTVAEVAAAMGIGKANAYALTKQEGFPVIHIGRRFVIPKEAFNTWLNSQQKGNNYE
jgi:excisionase family DNA binding protein